MSEQTKETLPLRGIDHVEFYVGNAKQAAHFYKTAFGFQSLAYAGPETGVRDRASYVLQQKKVTFIFTSPLHEDHPISDHIKKHGDGVRTIAFEVEDAAHSWQETTSRGATSFQEPTTQKDENGTVVVSGIHTYGDTIHLFVDRNHYDGPFLPGYEAWSSHYNPEPTGLIYVDHCVGNVGWGQMNTWCEFYRNVMGFDQLISFDDKDISTEFTALMSKVMTSSNQKVKFPINEPAKGKKKSQIEEYIEFYNGAGVQHVAIGTGDILTTVTQLRDRGVEFLYVPGTYYDDLIDRVGEIEEELQQIRELGILVDRDEDGYLLQIFTKPVQDRPTVFFEIIQRKGARSFGKGNFKALFESIEREQERRGNL